MAKITARENGPILVETESGYVLSKDGKEETVEQKIIALCRCGGSANKPYCDGSHKRIEFRAEGFELRET